MDIFQSYCLNYQIPVLCYWAIFTVEDPDTICVNPTSKASYVLQLNSWMDFCMKCRLWISSSITYIETALTLILLSGAPTDPGGIHFIISHNSALFYHSNFSWGCHWTSSWLFYICVSLSVLIRALKQCQYVGVLERVKGTQLCVHIFNRKEVLIRFIFAIAHSTHYQGVRVTLSFILKSYWKDWTWYKSCNLYKLKWSHPILTRLNQVIFFKVYSDPT